MPQKPKEIDLPRIEELVRTFEAAHRKSGKLLAQIKRLVEKEKHKVKPPLPPAAQSNASGTDAPRRR